MSEKFQSSEDQVATMQDLRNAVASELPAKPTVADILEFAHNLFPHGQEQPASFDPFTILADGRAGEQMRCVEHALLAIGLLTAYNIPARLIAGLALDPDVPGEFAGHVFAEYWDDRAEKWVMTDVQWGITPMQMGSGLSSLELREAISTNEEVEFERYARVRDDAQTVDYREWISPYLDIFDTPGILPLARSLTPTEHVSRFRMSLPCDENMANQYRGTRSQDISTVTAATFYVAPEASLHR